MASQQSGATPRHQRAHSSDKATGVPSGARPGKEHGWHRTMPEPPPGGSGRSPLTP
jgi:hypothetical protein